MDLFYNDSGGGEEVYIYVLSFLFSGEDHQFQNLA